MTAKIPEHIKKNFICKRIWRDVHVEDENAVLLWIGNVGKGKSTQAITFCQSIDPTFCLERVVYSVEELLDLTNTGKLKRGSAILFDEIAGSEHSADSRRSLSHVNQILSYISTTIRSDGYIIVYCAPMLSQVDKREKLIGTKGMFTAIGISRAKKESYAWFNWVFLDSKSSKVYFPRPIFLKNGEPTKIRRITFHYPTDLEFIKSYKEKKENTKTQNKINWQNQLIDKRTVKTKLFSEIYAKAKTEIDGLITVVDKKVKVVTSSLEVNYDISERIAVKLKAALQADIDTGRLKVCLVR